MLVLASASPRRRELLQLAGVAFTVAATDIDEQLLPAEEPAAFSRRMARLKCEAAAARCQGWILAADTVVALEREVFGKPADAAEAADMLRRLSGRWHRVYTSVTLWRQGTARREFTAETEVLFRELDERTITWYIQSGEPLDKAGAYAIQGKGALLVRAINGSYTNVVGLPLIETLELLAEAGLWPGPGAAGGES